MSFIWSPLLYLLLCVPLLVLFYMRMEQRRRRFVAQFGNWGVAYNPGRARVQRHIPAVLFLLGITVLLFSLARPQTTMGLPRLEGTIILTFDVSGSMAADDVKPTRMEVAKAIAREFVANQPSSVSIGVVAFSDGGISVQYPTMNREDVLATIDRLVPRRGTSVGNGILVALNTIVVNAGDPPLINTNNPLPPEQMEPPQGWYPSAAIVLLSDGENNQEPDPTLVSDFAADLGVRIYTVGVGTLGGATLEIDGFTVHSQLNEAVLRYIAENTGGVYYNAGYEEELNRIYQDLQPKLTIRAEKLEITFILAGLAMFVLLIGGMLSLLWFGRVP
ncbi:MAG TPA: VWA domain-containing protein [Anaerolineales bacterium]|nr:VWA domain-containing protein [Anaerolineales bacterium]